MNTKRSLIIALSGLALVSGAIAVLPAHESTAQGSPPRPNRVLLVELASDSATGEIVIPTPVATASPTSTSTASATATPSPTRAASPSPTPTQAPPDGAPQPYGG